ncbi:hypothetical protein EUX98_g9079 [Antrodiella citrinella]|uniref:Uncharacterized protein n=1 Tax=Antrodiella citrinella TaxID=2447956 RepID=A0A4S4M0M7_9APHY|nr:hypothetical protein EUX98_g9079 [Antrodiella citrinella]
MQDCICYLRAINHHNSTIHVRSDQCTGEIVSSGTACGSCQGAVALCEYVAASARKNSVVLHHASYSQLVKKLNRSERQGQTARLKNLQSAKALKRLRVHQETWRVLFKLLGTHDVPGLHRIFKNSMWNNWSAEKLLEKVAMARDGKYLPRNYSPWEFDLAIAIYELGGAAALHALHNSPFALPTRTTLIDRRKDFHIRISIGSVNISDILANIETMFSDVGPHHKRVGIVLSMDEVASDGRLCYLTATDEIAGVCEHAETELNSVKMGKNTDVIRIVCEAVRAGKIHVGQEVLVAAFARLDETDYGAKPCLLLPTCKRGSYMDAALHIEKLRQAWDISPYGARLHGPILSMSSDGDPKRRPAYYVHCMVRRMVPSDPLFPLLGQLPGLNLRTGRNFETQDFDYKHTFKRICKLVCTRDGLVVNETVINKGLLALWLEHLTDTDWSQDSLFELLNPNSPSSSTQRVNTLLSPKDPQDVPRAVKLLTLIGDIRHMDTSELDPSEAKTHRSLSLLGETLNALTEPFVDPTLSLSKQIISLVLFAHLACALFMKHGSKFMPLHLYSDLQCMVRTAIFHVAHTKLLDPELKVFLCLLGDDVLEVLFGLARMIGGHSPNVDVDMLGQRFGSVLRLASIFLRHPGWEQHPQRLRLKRSRDADHLSPRNWIGDLRASQCDLTACWEEGVRAAESLLKSFDYEINFSELFKKEGVDLMRPKGGKYPGISLEVDHSIGDSDTNTTLATDTNAPEIDIEAIGSDTTKFPFLSYDGQAELNASGGRTAFTIPEHSIWMELEGGKLAHKKTVLRHFTDDSMDNDYNRSHDRLLRVRYFSIGGDKLDRSQSSIYTSQSRGPGFFGLGSLYETLVVLASAKPPKIGLAILQCTSIKQGSQTLSTAPADEIMHVSSKFDVSRQILSFVPLTQLSQQTPSSPASSTITWAWDSNYTTWDPPPKAGSQKSAPTGTGSGPRLNISVHGTLTYPLFSPKVKSILAGDQILEPIVDSLPTSISRTWIVAETDLQKVEEDLHKRVIRSDEIRQRLQSVGSIRSGYFPYTVSIAPGQTLEHITSSISPPVDQRGSLSCCICNASVKGADRQTHMGSHIRCSINGHLRRLLARYFDS